MRPPSPKGRKGSSRFFRDRAPWIRTVLLAILLGTFFFSTQAQNRWVKFQGGGNVDETSAVTADSEGNTYMTGYFSTSAEVNGQTVSVSGLTDVFLSKVDPSGNTEWSVSAGGAQSDRGLGVAVDGSGNVFVCGFFSGSANFGNGVSINASGGGQDAFLAKYDAAGQALWARAGGSATGSDRANAVAVDASGNAFITGQFIGEAQFGSFALESDNGTNDVFVVKYGPDGSEQWAKSGSGDALNRGMTITTDNSGAVYAAGQFSGDITFDATYTNTILNALFLVKYDAQGDEQWVRWAGGGNQSIAYGLTSDGNNVYLTGDCGSSLTFFGGANNEEITASYGNAVFIASYGGSGQFLWGASESSTSPVSARGISYHGGQLAIAGWYECTFTTLSEAYGESYFNSIGFRDVFAMRYTSSGTFDRARNFGSQTAEEASDVVLLPDDREVVVGIFDGELIVPKSGVVDGLTTIVPAPNYNQTYCGDNAYGNFGLMTGLGNKDGFAVKAVDYDRQPYDYYVRTGGGCNSDIPDACIVPGVPTPMDDCPTEIAGCPPTQISAVNHTLFIVGDNEPSIVGFDYNTSWSPSGSGVITYATNPGTYSVTITSVDGCYSQSAEVEVTFGDLPPPPLMSDSEGINDEALSTTVVQLCPGETVDLWATFPDGFEFTWSGPGLTPDQMDDEIITVGSDGAYQITLTNDQGCTSSNFILVEYYPEPPEDIQPYLVFPAAEGDTVRLCSQNSTSIMVLDSLTGEEVVIDGFNWQWTASPNFSLITGPPPAYVSPPSSGWYEFTLDISVQTNPCFTDSLSYHITDSVYMDLVPLPEIFVELTGPDMACFGDTITLFLDHMGELTLDFTPIADFGDSLWVDGAGSYSASVDSTDNLTGCANSASTEINIGTASSPEIFSDPPAAVICPGDSVLLYTQAEGDIVWQGPTGAVSAGQQLYVSNPGLYFAEVQFYSGCNLVSNTLEVTEYNTPFLSSSGAVLCPGDSVIISVVSNAAENITWQSPFSGSDTSQVVTEPGTYSVSVTGCGITTQLSIEVELSADSLLIHRPDTSYRCEGDSILIIATTGYDEYDWEPTGQGDSIYVHENSTVQTSVVTDDGCTLQSNVLQIEFEPTPPFPDFDFVPVCDGMPFQLTIPGPYEVIFTDGFDGSTLHVGPTVSIPALVHDTVFYVHMNSELCRGPTDSLHISPKPYPPNPEPLSDAPICTGGYIHFLVLNDSAQTEYIWISPSGQQFTGHDIDHYVGSMDDAGTYGVYGDLEGCRTDTVYLDVDLLETQYVRLPADTSVCERTELIISPYGDFDSYEWQDGSTDSVFVATSGGEYFVTVVDANGCESTDVFHLELMDCEVAVPNVITINGDGRNDTWLIGVTEPGRFSATVYNRWGRVVYESTDHLAGWDGTHYQSGEPCSEGVYYYVISLRNLEGVDYDLAGPLTLIRE